MKILQNFVAFSEYMNFNNRSNFCQFGVIPFQNPKFDNSFDIGRQLKHFQYEMNLTLCKNLPNFVSPISKLHNIVIMDLRAKSFHAVVVIAKFLTFWFKSSSTVLLINIDQYNTQHHRLNNMVNLQIKFF